MWLYCNMGDQFCFLQIVCRIPLWNGKSIFTRKKEIAYFSHTELHNSLWMWIFVCISVLAVTNVMYRLRKNSISTFHFEPQCNPKYHKSYSFIPNFNSTMLDQTEVQGIDNSICEVQWLMAFISKKLFFRVHGQDEMYGLVVIQFGWYCT